LAITEKNNKKKRLETWCFRCKGKRDIINPVFGTTANNRKICKGICVECEGKVSLMGGYAELPGIEHE
jgi:hypothetical protein